MNRAFMLPLHDLPSLPAFHWIPIGIFAVTYALIAFESHNATYLDRTAAAFCGAVAMILAGSLTLQDAYRSVNWDTISFLLGIMILVAHFRVSGFFDWIAIRVARLARSRFEFLILLVFTAGLLSAFFVNDTICLIFTPIVLAVTERLEIPPAPYVIALATSANVGSAMSVTGNPQNALIGVSAGFSFLGFLAHLAPVALLGLALNVLLLRMFFRKELRGGRLAINRSLATPPLNRPLLLKCGLSLSLILVLWVMNFSFPLVAISIGALILLIGRVPSQQIHDEVDWTLLLFFAALFVVIRGFETSGAVAYLVGRFAPGFHGGVLKQLFSLSGAMLALSNVVSNVPAVLLFRPFVSSLVHPHFVWLALAAASTLAGNSTPFSSVANLIVLQQANRKVKISFWEFTRFGVVLTVATTVLAVFVLAAQTYFFAHF